LLGNHGALATLRAARKGHGPLPSGSQRVNRGGSWNNDPANCRSANRNANDPSNADNNLGFRPALLASSCPMRRQDQAVDRFRGARCRRRERSA
jgi:hypothetical protein